MASVCVVNKGVIPYQKSSGLVRVTINSEMRDQNEVIADLVSRNGPLDVYCWYEGIFGLSASGAKFWQSSFFNRLLEEKSDLFLKLYSLVGWNFDTTAMKVKESELSKAINKINSCAVKALCASDFFKYCNTFREGSNLYQFVSSEFPQKEYLSKLSESFKPKGKTVNQFFGKEATLFGELGNRDVKQAYSAMQYFEIFYLIRRSIEERLPDQKEIQIAFVFPNDEWKYYQDLEKDLERMLLLDDIDLRGIKIDVSILCFKYKDGSSNARPYYMTEEGKIKPNEINQYLPASKA